MKNLISIVVPIYNVESYLRVCIESIIVQSYKNIEIILVDDGSTDNSAKICDEYASKDKRIKVIHQPNGGLTTARKAGVNLASGSYVGFVDGDDWIDEDMYEKLYMYTYAESIDVVTSSGYREYIWGTGTEILGDTIPVGKYEVNSSNEYILKHIFSSSFDSAERINGAVWNKLFRREIICDILNEMDNNIHGFMDDNVCVVGAIINSKKIYVTHECLYHHREHERAFEYSSNEKGLLQINYAYLGLKKIIEKSRYREKLYPLLCEHTSVRIVQAYNRLFENEILKLPQYLFKCSDIAYDSKVVIYGAGKVGKDYERQFRSEGRYEIIGFVDANADKLISNTKIYNVEELPMINYDFIIIAIADEKIANSIKNTLLKMGINKKAIVWKKPISIFEYFN